MIRNFPAASARPCFRDLPKTYRELVGYHLPRPIHDETQADEATVIVDALAGHELTGDQEEYVELLATLIRDYEDRHHPLAARRKNGVGALRYLLKENGMTAADLSRLLGVDRTLGSKILRGERKLTLRHAAKLSRRFKVHAELFVA